MPPKLYYCDCEYYCRGQRTQVSNSTYHRHAPHRNILTPIPQALVAAHSGLAVIPPAASVAPASNLAGPSSGLPANRNIVNHPTIAPVLQDRGRQDVTPDEGVAGNSVDGPSTNDDWFVDVEEDMPQVQAPPTQAPAPASVPAPLPPPFDDSLDPNLVPAIDSLRTALEFRRALEAASLDNGDLSVEDVYRLRHPVEKILEIDNPDVLLALRLFLSTTTASDKVYNDVRADILERHPEDKILSLASVKKEIEQLTGVVPIISDMCPSSCIAYTGPYANLDRCAVCDEPRYDPILLETSGGKTKRPRQHLYTMPIGPQLQSFARHPVTADHLGHRARRTQEIIEELEENDGVIPEYDDIYHSQNYLEAVARGDISPDDIVLMFAMDGAQLYQDKQSDCWMYMWVIFEFCPTRRYRKKYVIPGGIIPGPNNPKNSDSFLFPGFHHLAAIQKEGLRIWNAKLQRMYTSFLYLYLGGADGPGSVHFTGLVGHHGAYPCRLYCQLKGRHIPGGPHYYPALLKPINYTVIGCDHDDVNPDDIGGCSPDEYHQNLVYLLNSRNPTDYKKRRKDTGIGYPSIFEGLPPNRRQRIPAGFPGDSMHGPTLNLGDLLIPLWRGSFHCATTDDLRTWDWAVLTDDIWKSHGAAVGACKEYLPGFIDHPPRNIAEKVSSGYKAKEWQTYLYGLAPALLHNLLPKKYWQSFCKLVYAIRILHQHRITQAQLLEANKCLKMFCIEFEELYVQRRTDRLHIVRPCIHALIHMAPETARVGPIHLYATWTMERLIGDLGSELRQPSNPYQNLSQRGLRRCQINALKAACPELDRTEDNQPRYSIDIGDGYVLLRAKERYAKSVGQRPEGAIVKQYLEDAERKAGSHVEENAERYPRFARWARLLLPNGQIARSAWKENARAFTDSRRARCIKIKSESGQIDFAEVQYFFNAIVGDERQTLALVSVYSRPDEVLFNESCSTVWSVTEQGLDGYRVIEVKSILAVVSVIPHDHHVEEDGSDERFFIIEQMGMEMGLLSNTLDSLDDDNGLQGDDE